MISYYPSMGRLNEVFDREVQYKEGDLETESNVQALYELCAEIYTTGFCDGVDRLRDETVDYLNRRADEPIYYTELKLTKGTGILE